MPSLQPPTTAGAPGGLLSPRVAETGFRLALVLGSAEDLRDPGLGQYTQDTI